MRLSAYVAGAISHVGHGSGFFYISSGNNLVDGQVEYCDMSKTGAGEDAWKGLSLSLSSAWKVEM